MFGPTTILYIWTDNRNVMERNADMPGRGQGKKLPKIFVLDTNIILHDYKAIHHFQENDIVIPITVLEELDKFKKGHDTLSFNAREFMREIDRLTDRKKLGRNGVPIAKHLGNLMIELSHPFPDELKGCFQDDIPDHRILATAIWVKAEHPDRFVALVTKDVNLRMKAKAVGMEAQDYLTDRIEESRLEYTRNEVEVKADVPAEKLQALAYGAQGSIPFGEILDKEPLPNQLFQFKWDKDGSETVCARYDARGRKIVLVKKKYAYGISPRNDEQKFALDACLNPESLSPLPEEQEQERLSSPSQLPLSRSMTSIRSYCPGRQSFSATRTLAFSQATRRARWGLSYSRFWTT